MMILLSLLSVKMCFFIFKKFCNFLFAFIKRFVNAFLVHFRNLVQLFRRGRGSESGIWFIFAKVFGFSWDRIFCCCNDMTRVIIYTQFYPRWEDHAHGMDWFLGAGLSSRTMTRLQKIPLNIPKELTISTLSSNNNRMKNRIYLSRSLLLSF